MEWLVMVLPMLIDQYKASGQDIKTMPAPAFASSARVHQGMKAADLIKQLGMPRDVDDSLAGGKMLVYRGPMCSMDNENCYVWIDKGVVMRMMRIKPQYMAGI